MRFIKRSCSSPAATGARRLEALRYDVTPTGLHYLLSHFDTPAVRPDRFRLELCGLVGRELTLGLCRSDGAAAPSPDA